MDSLAHAAFNRSDERAAMQPRIYFLRTSLHKFYSASSRFSKSISPALINGNGSARDDIQTKCPTITPEDLVHTFHMKMLSSRLEGSVNLHYSYLRESQEGEINATASGLNFRASPDLFENPAISRLLEELIHSKQTVSRWARNAVSSGGLMATFWQQSSFEHSGRSGIESAGPPKPAVHPSISMEITQVSLALAERGQPQGSITCLEVRTNREEYPNKHSALRRAELRICVGACVTYTI